MYYSDELIEEVRIKNPIVDVISSYVHLSKRGSNYVGLCPFHNEKTPSFSVSPGRGIFHCFGCGAGGNVFTFVMYYENFSFPEAMQKLADRAGVVLPKQEYTKEMKEAKDQRARLLEMHKAAAIFYVSLLHSEEGKMGMDYFKKRGLTDETIRDFGLGYTGTSSRNLYQYLKKKGYRDEDLKESGLVTIRETGGSDKFWNRVMFPIMDTNNRVIAFGGRVLGQGEPKYLNSQETKIFDKSRNLYGLHEARKTHEKYMLLCEGYLDVISLHQAGFKNAVASLGTAFTSSHGMILKRYTDEVVLCYDNDNAGRKAILRAAPMLRSAGLKVNVIDLAPYKDPDEFIVNLGADEFRLRAEKAINAFLFEIQCLRENYDFSDPQDKANFFQETAKRIAGFQNEIERNSYTESVANTYGMDYAVLKAAVNKAGNEIGLAKKSEEEYQPKSLRAFKRKDSGITEAQKLVLTEILDDPSLFKKAETILKPSDFSTELLRDLAEKIYEGIRKGAFDQSKLVNQFIDTDRYKEVVEFMSSDFSIGMNPEERMRVFSEALYKIKSESIEEQMKNATDAEVLMKLMKEKQELCRSEKDLK